MIANLYDIVERLGGDVSNGGRCALVPGPGHSRRDRSLSLRLSEGGNRVVFYSHAGDSVRTVMDYLGIEASPSSRPVSQAEIARAARARAEAQRAADAEDRAFCMSIWNDAVPIDGTPAERYLWSRRILLEPTEVVRFHPAAPRCKPDRRALPNPPAPHPAMVALVTDKRGEPIGLHLTYVAADGSGKAFGASSSRLIFGPIRGGYVRLAPIRDGVVAVSEGIETGAAFMQETGLPTWPCLNTSGMAGAQLPSGIRRLVIAADHDVNGAGIKAATALAERMSRVCDVEIHIPSTPGDWADPEHRSVYD